MQKTMLVYGSISGLIAICAIVAGLALSGGEGFMSSEWLGYLVMLVALSLIFVGTKHYRDTELGGTIKFGRALLLGVGIAAVAGVVYVVVWEIYLAATDYAFIDNYAQGVIESKKAAGLSGDALQAELVKMEDLKTAYANPWMRLPITFVEIFPVGVMIALISAALLRNPEVLPASD